MSNGDDDPATGPFSGELSVVAADGSAVHLVAVSALDARLDLDLDGDGSIDESIDTTWQALLP